MVVVEEIAQVVDDLAIPSSFLQAGVANEDSDN